ncbi:hypothetical protein COL922a_004440 [Colletotrichum nupharicola]|nr:hypothetical protein COL922a_004440 [Colletotrichum nupharicola]
MTQVTTSKPAQTWQEVVAKKRLQRQEAIATAVLRVSTDTSGSNEGITAIPDAEALVERVSRGEVSSEAVVKAYIKNLTEVLFEEALERAKDLDAYFAKNGTVVGPLHGVPVTLKDQFNVKGFDSTLGYVGRSFSPASDDAAVVKMLKSLGAIVIAKTNLPQSIMWCETDNPLWGLTTNPLSKEYTPGGSTGGEAALLATQGSMLGWGTDIGGSIRIPSHMNGTYGFKPSSARLPYRGVPVSTEGQEHVPSAIGPMARIGHEVLEWNADLHEDCIRVMDLYYTADGCEDIRKDVIAGGEPFILHVERLINRGKAISVYDYWQLNRRKWDMQQAYMEKWRSIRSPTTGRAVDILLMPPMSHSAVPHAGCRWVGYTKVWNFLDYPALVIHGGKVSQDDLSEPWTYETRGPEDEWNKKLWEENGKEMSSLGLSVGLQIVGRKLEKETVLAAGKIIDDLIQAA